MTNDEIVARGTFAARYLADAELMSFFAELSEDIKTSLFNTSAEDCAQRERLYFQFQAIDQVFDRMRSYEASAEQIIANR